MAIYSQELGHINVTDTTTFHTLYTVPLSGGPAIIRSLTMQANPGTIVLVRVVFPDTVPALIGYLDNSTGAIRQVQTVQFYQPIPPGTTIQAENNFSTAGPWSVVLGGYQFSTP